MIKGGKGTQLKMFMSASEIRQEHRIHWSELEDYDKRGKLAERSVPAFFDAKRAEAEESGHAEAIRQGGGGIDKPIHLSTASVASDMRVHKDRPGLVGGMHRVAVMLHEDPDRLLPVVHHEDIAHAKIGHVDSTMAGPFRKRQDFPYS